METVTVYLEPKQKRGLKKRAKEEQSNFSEQVRTAIDRYLANPQSPYLEESLDELIAQTDKSMKNIIRMLDETSVAAKSTLSRVRSKLETL